eukprot:g6593.t1
MPLDNQMIRLKRLAQVREEKLRNQASGDSSGLPRDREEDAGVPVNEHADTWGFSWMPAIEDFVEQAAKEDRRDDEESDRTDDNKEEEEQEDVGPRARAAGRRSRSGSLDPNDSTGGEPVPGSSSLQGSGRKRRRPRASGWSPSSSSSSSPSSRRRAPRPPSYNETLLADKSFHNPHASETMADAFGILRPASFVLDVDDDDRPWGGGAEAVAAGKGPRTNGDGVKGASASAGGASGGGGGGEDDRNWFYDTVRDRQNRLWADTRVRKGVELARKGQHQAAVDVYTQALGMCPDHDDGLVARGAAFATTGRLRQAVQDLAQALNLNPHNDNAARYLKETQRRMERQDTRSSPGSTANIGNASRLEHRAGPSATDKLDIIGGPPSGNLKRGEEASRAALGALPQDGAEADALRRMRALLEEDQRKRKRGGGGDGGDGGGGGGGGGGSSSNQKKKSRKDKKSSSKSRRSNSSLHRHKKRDRRESGGDGGGGGDGEAGYDSSGSSNSTSNSTSTSSDARSSSSKKKRKKQRKNKKKHKKEHHKHKKRSSAGSRNGTEGRGGLSSKVPASLSAGGGETSDDDAHPILQRKKHSLWG